MQWLQTCTLHSDTQVRLCTATGQWALDSRSYVICFYTKACWHGMRWRWQLQAQTQVLVLKFNLSTEYLFIKYTAFHGQKNFG